MNTVISYPYFYPTRHWLKVAALCWDKVYTLRDPLICREPDDISELDHALGGILDSIDIKTVSGDSQIKEDFELWIASHVRQLRSPQAIARSQFILLDGMFESNLDYDAFKNTLRRFGIYSEGTLSEKQLPSWEFEPRLTYAEAPYVSEDPDNLRSVPERVHV